MSTVLDFSLPRVYHWIVMYKQQRWQQLGQLGLPPPPHHHQQKWKLIKQAIKMMVNYQRFQHWLNIMKRWKILIKFFFYVFRSSYIIAFSCWTKNFSFFVVSFFSEKKINNQSHSFDQYFFRYMCNWKIHHQQQQQQH